MVIALIYVALILFGVGLAALLWRFPAVRELDDRLLGQRGVATVVSAAALLLLAATGVTVYQRFWGMALVYALTSTWVGYWAYRRVANLGQAPRG